MKYNFILILATLLTFSSCTTYSEWSRGTTGAYVGSMFGSLIGDIVGGPRSGAVGAIVGGAIGAGAGVASAKAEQERRQDNYNQHHQNHHQQDQAYYDDVHYDNGKDYYYIAPTSPADFLEVRNLVFADENSNRSLERGETAYIIFEIHNQSDRPIYNVAPIITCSNKHIRISPTATIARIDSHRGMRYKAMIIAQRNVKPGPAIFSIGFAEQGYKTAPAKTFRIDVRR